MSKYLPFWTNLFLYLENWLKISKPVTGPKAGRKAWIIIIEIYENLIQKLKNFVPWLDE